MVAMRGGVHRRVTTIAAALAVSLAGVAAVASPAAAATPLISIGDSSVVEGQDGNRYFRFAVTLSEPNLTSTVTVHYSTVDGDAVSPGDYRAKSGTLTFKPKVTAKNVAILVRPDTGDEADETFEVHLDTPQNADLGRAVGIGTVLDDDPNVGLRVGVGDAAFPETCTGKKFAASVPISLSARRNFPITVHAETSSLGASPGADYTHVAKNFTFTSGQSANELKVPILPGAATEGDEQIRVTLSFVSGAEGAVGRSEGTITILDCAA
jgi:hypothetical protein